MSNADSNKSFLVGKYNGQLLRYDRGASNQIRENLIFEANSKITGIALYPDAQNFIFSTQNGELFYSADRKTSVIEWDNAIQQRPITSLALSTNQQLLSTGTDETQTILWDLRPTQLQKFSNKRLNEFSTEDWNILKFIVKSAKIDQGAWNLLHYCILILEERFRFDIEISNSSLIQAGEFDITLEE